MIRGRLADLAAPLGLTDRLVVVYDLGVLALILASAPHLSDWGSRAAAHLGVIAGVWLLARFDPGADPEAGASRSAVRFAHLWYPVFLFIWLYGEAGELRHLLVPHDLDPLVLAWETRLFPGRLYTLGPRLLGVPALEVLHSAYFSYYLLLAVPGMLAQLLRPRLMEEIERYLFVLTLCMLSLYSLSFLFPTAGPLAFRRALMPAGVFFIPLMNDLYGAFDHGGLAFPSIHAAAAIVAGWYAGRFFPRWRPLFAAQVLLLLAATVLCSYHYTVDTVAGVASGVVFLALGPRLRRAWRERRKRREEDRSPPVGSQAGKSRSSAG